VAVSDGQTQIQCPERCSGSLIWEGQGIHRLDQQLGVFHAAAFRKSVGTHIDVFQTQNSDITGMHFAFGLKTLKEIAILIYF